MTYFPHAFQKMLIATNATAFRNGNGTLNTLDLLPGQLGVVNAKTHRLIDIDGTPAASYAVTPMVYLAQGSFHVSDKIGPFHGGYKETVKSKGINPKYVSKFYVVEPAEPQNQIITVTIPTGNVLPTNKTYRLLFEIKGSPAMRFATRNLYKTLDGFTGCPGSPDAPVSALTILEQWADQINEDEFLKSFVSAAVTDIVDITDPLEPVVEGHTLTITIGYVNTQFGDTSFDPKDHFEIEPIQMYASALTEEGNPCDVSLFVVSESQEARQGKGYGETLIRELILDKRYRQEPWQQDSRMREILSDTSLTDLNRNTKYVTYHILHSVPRSSNPSGVFDSDQYLIKIVVSARSSLFEAYMNALLTSAGSAVQLEVLL
jgi:hypothetical protein